MAIIVEKNTDKSILVRQDNTPHYHRFYILVLLNQLLLPGRI